jgi:hypothetical protein
LATTNYNIPTFSATDNVDLIGVYNVAMNTIDTTLKQLNDTLSTIQGSINNIPVKNASDDEFTVTDLSNAKITSNGFVYSDKA